MGIFVRVPIESMMSCVTISHSIIFFQTRALFSDTLREIKKRVKPGGVFIGIIPDSEQIMFKTPFTDSYGNFFQIKGDE